MKLNSSINLAAFIKKGGPAVLILSLLGFYSSASWGNKTGSVLEQAEDLVLKSKRTEALKLLADEWQLAKPAQKTALAAKMEELARVFMTERGQKSYELGQSLTLEKASLAENHYQEALKVEDNNSSVLMALIALRIRERNWSQALEGLDHLIKILPTARDAKILRVRVLLMTSKLNEAQAALESLQLNGKKSELEDLAIELSMRQEKYDDANARLAELLRKQPENPELYYLKWRLEQLQKLSNQEPAQKYLELCKKSAPTTLKQLGQNPFKCLEQLEVAKIIDEFEAQTR